MGKYIKGRKLPKGILQRKDDGKLMAGFAGKWLYEMRHQDEYGDCAGDITVDEWFEFWHTELIMTWRQIQ